MGFGVFQASVWWVVLAGMVTAFSWWGWGRMLERVLAREGGRRGWALMMTWGMAWMIAIGGAANWLGMQGVAFNGAMTVAGILLGILTVRWRPGEGLREQIRRGWGGAYLMPLAVAGAGVLVAGAAYGVINRDDDALAYLCFPKQMLESGTMLDAFNLRRLVTYGGHQILQTQLLALLRWMTSADEAAIRGFAMHWVDRGICPVVMAGLVWEVVRPRTRVARGLVSLAVLVVLCTPFLRLNLQSQASTAVLCLGLLITMRRVGWRGRGAVVVGLLAAAMICLRANLLPFVAVLMVGQGMVDVIRLKVERGRIVWGWVVAGAVCAACVLPGAWLLWKSSGTWFYPVMTGNLRPDFSALSVPMPMGARLVRTAELVGLPQTLFWFLPLVWLGRWRGAGLVVMAYAAAAVMVAGTAWSLTANDGWVVYRYSYPVLMACAFFAVGVTLRRWKRNALWRNVAVVVFLILLPASQTGQLFLVFQPPFGTGLLALAVGAVAVAGMASKVRQRVLAICVAVGVGVAIYMEWGGVFRQVSGLMYMVSLAGLAAMVIGNGGKAVRIAAVAGMAELVWVAVPDVGAVGSFAWPMGVVAGCVLVAWMVRRWEGRIGRGVAVVLLGAAVVVLVPAGVRSVGMWSRTLPGVAEEAAMRRRLGGYQRVQRGIAEGERVLVLVKHPWLFDFSRNAVEVMDEHLAVGPPPGIFGREAATVGGMRGYLKSVGIDAVVIEEGFRANRDSTEPGRVLEVFRQLGSEGRAEGDMRVVRIR